MLHSPAAGQDVHTLIMSATPSRVRSLVLFGHTDISIVDEFPPGRKEIKTYLIHGRKYNDMIVFIKNEIFLGRQAYIVCPLIEDNEGMEASLPNRCLTSCRNVIRIRMAPIHGKLKNAEKQEIMDGFSCGKLQILVSTTVIEVGINVPNATVMAVMNAERFGARSTASASRPCRPRSASVPTVSLFPTIKARMNACAFLQGAVMDLK